MSGEDCPPAISQALLDQLGWKMGDETVSIQSLQDNSQRNLSVAIDLNNLQLLTNKITGLEIKTGFPWLASCWRLVECDTLTSSWSASPTSRIYHIGQVQAGHEQLLKGWPLHCLFPAK